MNAELQNKIKTIETTNSQLIEKITTTTTTCNGIIAQRDEYAKLLVKL